MLAFVSIRGITSSFVRRDPLFWNCCLTQNVSNISLFSQGSSLTNIFTYITLTHQRSCNAVKPIPEMQRESFLLDSSLVRRSHLFEIHNVLLKWLHAQCMSNASFELKTEDGVARFSMGKPDDKSQNPVRAKKPAKRVKMSKKAKLNELRFYRLKAKKKMTSPNPEVRIRYKLEKAKRKEEWLIEKLKNFEVPKILVETYDPEILTEEERFYLKRTGEKKKNYVPVGRRGVFGGVVLNMHLHWKKHETVKVICKPCKPGQIHDYAVELARLSKGIVIDIKPNNTIIFYRGKNYVQPKVMSPPDTLSKNKALEKFRFEQSLEHTSQFIEKLEKELEEYQKHLAKYRKVEEYAPQVSVVNT